MDLSVLIPARNEMFLRRTVEDVLAHAKAETEVIVVLDGAWAEPPLEAHPKVTVVYHPESVGQRAATNEAARIARGRYVMKLDAHCSLAAGFDVALIEAAKELGPKTVQIPAQFNLHVYDQVCEACGKRTDQAPSLTKCECGAAAFRKEVVWERRRRTKTTTWSFDENLHFQYAGEMANRPEAKADIHDVMTSLGACFFMERERFWEIDGLDERHGSWGQYGVEIALKSWLSGGRHVVNKRTHFAHFFRVGGIGFPYEIKGSDQEKARQHSRRVWRGNLWPKQTLPLSWVLNKFWPVVGWSDAAHAAIAESGRAFMSERGDSLLVGEPVPLPVAGLVGGGPSGGASRAPSVGTLGADSIRSSRQLVSASAHGLSGVDGSRAATPHQVLLEGDEPKVGRVAAPPGVASDVVELRNVSTTAAGQGFNEPGVEEPVREVRSALEGETAVACADEGSGPQPAASAGMDSDLSEDAGESLAVEVGDCQNAVSHSGPPFQASNRSGAGGALTPLVPSILHPPRKGVVYYSDCRGDETILSACRAQLKRAANGHRIVAVTLAPLKQHFDRNIVMSAERGHLTMFRQILAGLEASDADYVFLAEHDVVYHPSHFDFVPPCDDTYYYNLNVWKVDAATGRALHYITKQTSGLCASRKLLLAHYRARVERVEREGFTRAMGFEPGTHRPPRGIDVNPSGEWRSAVPNVDIRHGHNLTANRWSREQFRDQRNCKGWTEADEVPGWGVTQGRFDEWLRELGG